MHDPQRPSDEPPSIRAGAPPALASDAARAETDDGIGGTVPASGDASFPVVGLGGSAGSIDALVRFFERTAADSGFAYVVVLHLSADHHSRLPELLQRHAAIPVHAAQEAVRLAPDTVHVIPPGKHLTCVDGHLRLTDIPHEHGKRVAVDLFFRSLADTHGDRATAIVLSGADGDGALGLKRIKESGGLTIAQDPEEADHANMPDAAIATGMVDWVLPVAEMPGCIAAYHASRARLRLPPEESRQPAKAVEPPADDAEALLREVLAFLHVRTGHDFSYYKRGTIVRRISRRMQVGGVDDLAAYLELLRTTPAEAGTLLQDLLISVTTFFRDREMFDALEVHFAELFRGKRPGDAVRIWCPGCATGEEAYSMAMLLLEHAEKLDATARLQVFGCDLDEAAIRVARAGLYPDSISADVSEERLRRFFIKEATGYRVSRRLREMVLFATHDLLKDAPFSRMDLVSCRNLLIYLNPDAQARACEIFNFALRPGGLLFLGTSESIEAGSTLFAPLDKKHRIYRQLPAQRRVGAAVPMGGDHAAIQRVLQQLEHSKDTSSASLSSGFSAAPARSQATPGADVEPAVPANELHFRLVSEFGPPSVVVNGDDDIVHLSENANRFLQLSEGAPSRDLLRLVHPFLRVDLRAGLLRARDSAAPAVTPPRVIDLPGGPKVVEIRLMPAGRQAPGHVLVLFDEHEPAAAGQVALPTAPAEAHSPAVVAQLERELSRANATMRSTVEQYEASTEELRASNEELQAMNEELRSAGEELETGREELQSLNEELTTVNTEFKDRVEELSRANSYLQNLMTATQIATVFLGRELQVMRYTPAAAPLFKLIAGDIGRPITDLNHRLGYPELIGDAREVLRTLVPVERELRSNGRWFLVRVLPYRTLQDHIAGVVLTFLDVTERRRAEEARRESEARWHLLIESARDYAIFTFDPGRRITSWSAGAVEMLGYSQGDILGRASDILFTPSDREQGAPAHEAELARVEGLAVNERLHVRKDGTRFFGSGTVRPLSDAAGEAIGFVKIMRDLTEQRRAEDAQRASDKRQAFLLKLSDSLRPLADAAAIEGTTCRLLAEHLGADRAFYCQFFVAEGATLVQQDYVRGDVPSLKGTYAISDFAWMIELYGRGPPVVVRDVWTADIIPDAYRAASAAAHIAWIVVPLMRSGAIVGTLCVADMRPRDWVDSEVEIVRETAERLWATIERGRAEQALRKSEERYRTLFDSMDQGYCIIQMLYEDGKPVDWLFVEVNPAFEKHNGLANAVGRTMRELAPRIEQKWMDVYGRVAETGESLRFEEDSRTLGRSFDLYAFRVGRADERKVAVLFTDITARAPHERRPT